MFIVNHQTPIYILTQIPVMKPYQLKVFKKYFSLRLHRFCSSDINYIAKSKEYTKCLANRGHDRYSKFLIMLVKYHDKKHGKKQN